MFVMDRWCSRRTYPGVFATFVCVTLSLLLGMHLHTYLSEGSDLEADFSDIKYVIIQLTKGLSDVTDKHDRLAHEFEKITGRPSITSHEERKENKDIQEPKSKCCHDVVSFDRQMTDFALESAGARILDTGCTIDHVIYESPVGWALHVLSSIMCRACVGARAMLRPGTLPGECWAFKGNRGEAIIRLVGSVIITGISIEHIPATIAPVRDVPSAPRHFQLEGLEDRRDQYPHDFGTFEFDKDGRQSQYFEVSYPPPKPYNIVKFTVLTNWGHPVYTCVYRLRIHGELAPGQTPKSSKHHNLNEE